MNILFNFFSLFIFSSFISFQCFSQAPDIEWQNTIGGDEDDFVNSIIPTADNGYFLAGYSNSNISDDKTEDAYYYSPDFWIMKIDSIGNIQWQNTIGGLGYDYISHAIKGIDGGYLLVGYSGSGISGDKNEPLNGGHDIWVVKVNEAGNIEWQNTIGGSGMEEAKKVIECSDGNYIIAGRSDSNISGDKTENSQGSLDYWILKLNSTGSVLWQNTIGGSSSEYIEEIIETADNEIMVFGDSFSDVSGDKTIPSYGQRDFWILNLDSFGNIQWQKVIGGSDDDILNGVVVCPEGGYLLGGNSSSSISGDKTENIIGGYDYWVVKISDEGIVEWDETIGGTNSESMYSLEYFYDGYIIGGYSKSGVTGDKTEPSNGGEDYWLVKIDNIGNIIYQKAYGGNGDDAIICTTLSLDGNLILGGYSSSGLSGDKSEPNLGGIYNFDIWLINLLPVCIPSPEICNIIDDNCNGLIDEDVIETISISASGPTTFCNGGNVVLNATYTGETIQWKKNGYAIPGATSDSYTASAKGFYTCETYSSCDTITSTSIFVNTLKGPPASITAGGPTTFCSGGSVVLTANTGIGLSYQWYKGGTPLAGATSINYTATIAGNYKCKVTKFFTGCINYSNVISVSVPCKEGEFNSSENNSFTLFPNPANDKLNIQINSQLISPSSFFLTITDLEGRIIYSSQINSTTTEFNISDFASGMYFVKVEIDGIEMIEKFIKN